MVGGWGCGVENLAAVWDGSWLKTCLWVGGQAEYAGRKLAFNAIRQVLQIMHLLCTYYCVESRTFINDGRLPLGLQIIPVQEMRE
jgi:hypothetical protein